MRPIVRWGTGLWEVRLAPVDADAAALDLRDRDYARSFIRRLLSDTDNARVLRSVHAELVPGAARTNDAELAESLSGHAAAGRVRFIDPDDPGLRPLATHGQAVQAAPRRDQNQSQSSPPPRSPRPKTWVTLKVVDDRTGDPVPNVRMRITTPDGVEKFHTTNSAGLIELDGIDRGVCEAACEHKDLKADNTLDFVGYGEHSGAAPGGSDNARASGVIQIVQVEFYKVTAKDSLDSLAKKVGVTWKDLARFNWGTDKPDEINLHLRDDVGCTKTTASGKNYMFDDSDDPGLIRLPHRWSREDLKTGETHTIRVQPIPKPTPWRFSV